MDIQSKTAIIIGATGLTGGLLLRRLLEDSRYKKIKLFSRSPIVIEHTKIEEYLGAIINLEDFKDHFKADEVFCCIGTTKAKTPNKELYTKIDFGIPKKAAELCKANSIDTLIVISALGADSESKIFYNSIKGKMEKVVLDMHLPKTHIVQPSLIGGNRKERRIGEFWAKQIMKVLNVILVGPLKKYRSIDPKTIAKAMIWLANNEFGKKRISSDEIQAIGMP